MILYVPISTCIINCLFIGYNVIIFCLISAHSSRNIQVIEKIAREVISDEGGSSKCPWTPNQLKGNTYY